MTDQSQAVGARLLKAGFTLIIIALVGVLAYLIWQRISPVFAHSSVQPAQVAETTVPDRGEQEISGLTSLFANPVQGDFSLEYRDGIARHLVIDTIIPSRSRVDVITYTVQKGDSLFVIAENYSIRPETILWGNYETLQDNPHFLKPGQILNILPTNGVYYKWNEGDTIQGVAAAFGVPPQAIIEFAGNSIDLTQLNEKDSGIQPGVWIVIPGGKRAIRDWGPPAISRKNPASASFYGAGHCGTISEGAIGTGTFVWPTTEHFISGYHYDSSVHPAIDIGGEIGNPIFATDSGVVVYAGWSDYGYGYLIVIDHGNGWQSAYAHLSGVSVGCGQSVFQGGVIGSLGSTGNSSGPHLHFELSINGAKVNPIDYLP